MKRVLITGAARSGTGYVAKWLRRWCPLEPYPVVGHEDVYGLHRRDRHDGLDIIPDKLEWPILPSWSHYVIEVSWLAAPFLHRATRDTTVVVHLVRDPIKSIASIYRRGFLSTVGNPYGKFALDNLGATVKFAPEDSLELACYYWCEWNMMVLTSGKPVAVWRVESLSSVDLYCLLNTAQIPYTVTAPPDKDVNQGDGPHDPAKVPKCLADIPVSFQECVAEVGRLFGYEVI